MSFTIEFVSGVTLNLNDDDPLFLIVRHKPKKNNANPEAIETVFDAMNFWLVAHNVDTVTSNKAFKPVEINIAQRTGILIWLAEMLLSEKDKEKIRFDAFKVQQLLFLLEKVNYSDLKSERLDVVNTLKNSAQLKPIQLQATELQKSNSNINLRMNRSNSLDSINSDSFGTVLHKLQSEANQLRKYKSYNGSDIDTHGASLNNSGNSYSQILANNTFTQSSNSLGSSYATVIIKDDDDEKNNSNILEHNENYNAVADEDFEFAESEAAKLLEKHFEELWKGRVTILENDFYSIKEQQNYEFKGKKTEKVVKALLTTEQIEVFNLIQVWQSLQRNNNIDVSERSKALDVLKQVETIYQAALNSFDNKMNNATKNFYQSHSNLKNYFEKMDLLNQIQAPYLDNMEVKTYFFGLIKSGKEIKIPTKESEKNTAQPIRLAHHAVALHEYIRQARFFEVTPDVAIDNIYTMLSETAPNPTLKASAIFLKPANRSKMTHAAYINTVKTLEEQVAKFKK